MEEQNIEDQLLQKLNEYNESFLDDGYTQSSVKRSKKLKQNETDNTNNALASNKINRRKKKKERKRRQKELLQNGEEIKLSGKKDKVDNGLCNFTGEKRTLHELKSALGLDEFEQRLESEKRLENSDSSLKSKNKKSPEVVVYENPSKRKRKIDEKSSKMSRAGKAVDKTDDEFDMKRARYEVRKFGIKGFEGNKKEEAVVALLVQLGAKPPKNKYYNYKEFIEMKKTEKESQKKQKEIDRSLGYKVAPNRGQRKQKDRNDVGGYVDGQVGKYKDGVQFVKRADLKGFKMKRKK